jgi:C-terminal processing protease CtpA/Prc
MRRKLIQFVLRFAVIAAFAGAAFSQTGPQNLNFESGDEGGVPQGWRVTDPRGGDKPGYTAKLTHEQAKEGKYCAELAYLGDARGRFGTLKQDFDASAYRGKRIRFRAAVRDEVVGYSAAQLWVTVERLGGEDGFYGSTEDHPIREKEWRYYEIIGDIDPDAERISISLMLVSSGKAWIDDASFEVLGDTPKPAEPARALTSRGLENEIAFARLCGVVRYFHPSDEAGQTDWDEFVIHGVREVESAKNDDELAQKLRQLFAIAAPTMRVLRASQKYSLPAELQPPKDAPGLKITYWHHEGLGAKGTVYHSNRVQQDIDNSDDKGPRPGAPWKMSLTNNLTAWVPLALYADAKGTLPHAAASTAEPGSSEKPRWSAKERSVRLADVIIAWNVFEHFYPYFDVVKTDWSSVLPEMLERAATDKDEDAFNKTLYRLVAELHDGHGRVLKGGYSTTLPLQWDWIEEKLVITVVGDAAKGKLSPGDVVVKIDGKPASEALAAQEALVSGATVQFVRFRGLENLTHGPKNQPVHLTIEPFAQMGKTVEVLLPYQKSTSPLKEHRPDAIAEIEPGIYYIDIGRISESDFNSALERLKEAHGIIFDFRGYPWIGTSFLTHLTDQKMTGQQSLLPQVLWPDRQNIQFVRKYDWNLQPTTPLLTAKKVFIIDGRALSAAESCMGIVEYYKLGAIVGAPTAGTTGVYTWFPLPGGYGINWTGMKVLKHDGSRFHGVGILPTIPVARTRVGVAAGRDEFLESAIHVVRDAMKDNTKTAGH